MKCNQCKKSNYVLIANIYFENVRFSWLFVAFYSIALFIRLLKLSYIELFVLNTSFLEPKPELEGSYRCHMLPSVYHSNMDRQCTTTIRSLIRHAILVRLGHHDG